MAEAGKFTPIIINRVGFNMHEDQPEQIAQMITGIMTQRKIPAEWNTKMFIINAAGKKIFISH